MTETMHATAMTPYETSRESDATLIAAAYGGSVETSMATEPDKPRLERISKRGVSRKNGPTKRVEVTPLGPKAAKAAVKEREG